MTHVMELAEKITTVIITILHMFKKLGERLNLLHKEMEDIKHSQIKY